MNTLHVLYHMMRADFMERTRRYSFGAMLLFAIFLTYFFVPGDDTPFYAILVPGFQGYHIFYNSAWLGVAVTILMCEFMTLFGFYMVKNTVERDQRTGVGEIIATTPISRLLYALGKWLSNLALFAAMVAVILAATAVLQWLRAQDMRLDLWALAAPLLLVLLPALAVVAALAVLFECIPLLRGGLGNLVFVVVFAIITISTDMLGKRVLWPSVYQACSAHYADCFPVPRIDLDTQPISQLATFRYDGMIWTPRIILGRLAWVLVAAAIAMLAAAFFHRFDPARIHAGPFGGLWKRLQDAVLAFVLQPEVESAEPDETISSPVMPAACLSPLPADARLNGFQVYGQMLRVELRLMFKGVSWFWYLGAVGLTGALWIVPLQVAHFFLLPVAWIWPLFRWSALGQREVRHVVTQLVFTGPHPLRRHLVVSWLSGVLVALILGSGVLVRLALTAEWAASVAALVGAFFVPTLALAMGCWSGGSKLFEAFYLFFWYLVSIQTVAFLDFMGRFQESIAWGVPWIYAGATVLLLLAAILGRKRQLGQQRHER